MIQISSKYLSGLGLYLIALKITRFTLFVCACELSLSHNHEKITKISINLSRNNNKKARKKRIHMKLLDYFNKYTKFIYFVSTMYLLNLLNLNINDFTSCVVIAAVVYFCFPLIIYKI